MLAGPRPFGFPVPNQEKARDHFSSFPWRCWTRLGSQQNYTGPDDTRRAVLAPCWLPCPARFQAPAAESHARTKTPTSRECETSQSWPGYSWPSGGPRQVHRIALPTGTRCQAAGTTCSRQRTVASATASAVSCFRQAKPSQARQNHIGLHDHPVQHQPLSVKLDKKREQSLFGDLLAPIHRMVAIHQNFRFHHRNQSNFLA
jgi:hypothetical protein